MHSQNILHLVIKPQNILFKSTGFVKLAEFGVSTRLSHSGNQIHRGGTLSYVAPEVVQNEPFDQKVDLWALGCVLYFQEMPKLPFEVECNPIR